MPSSSSRLASWLRRRPEPETPLPEVPLPAPTGDGAAGATRARNVRLGLDFGTTTTLIAVRVDDDEPRLVPLETASDAMPSYYWRGDGDEEAFGARASNLPGPIHSIKLDLPANEATERTYGLRPSDIAFRIVEEAVRRAVAQLRGQGLLPPETDRLELVTNIGCSAAWSLETRSLMRDIAADAGLRVSMASVIEEPVAASLAVVLTGLISGGRLLVVDLGGGTLDCCVLSAEAGTNRFRIFASGGRDDLGGDRYTDLIAAELARLRVERLGPAAPAISSVEETRLWQLAEDTKRNLSVRSEMRVVLPGVEGPEATVTISREWFERAAGGLLVRTVAAVNDTYRLARLVLDRGQTPGDEPGTPYLSRSPVRTISNLRLQDDGLEHLDHVVLVGGATQMPALRQRFEAIFGPRIKDPSVFGLDPVEAVALGLAQHQAIESLDFAYPNWAIDVEFRDAAQADVGVVRLYSPFAPLFKLSMNNSTVEYSGLGDVPVGAATCRLVFRRIAPGEGQAWQEVAILAGSTSLGLHLSLLGDIRLESIGSAGTVNLYPSLPPTPWKVGGATHPDYLPPPVRVVVDEVCAHGARPGRCPYFVCRNHQSGGMTFDSD